MSHCTRPDLQERHQTTRKEPGNLRLIIPRSWVRARPGPLVSVQVSEVAPLKEQPRYRYGSILRRELLPVFGRYPLAKIHPHQVRAWAAGRPVRLVARRTARRGTPARG